MEGQRLSSTEATATVLSFCQGESSSNWTIFKADLKSKLAQEPTDKHPKMTELKDTPQSQKNHTPQPEGTCSRCDAQTTPGQQRGAVGRVGSARPPGSEHSPIARPEPGTGGEGGKVVKEFSLVKETVKEKETICTQNC